MTGFGSLVQNQKRQKGLCIDREDSGIMASDKFHGGRILLTRGVFG
jgi:hypothetical protein